MDINEIIPYARNARHNKKAIPAVADSIRQFGLRGQIVLESREHPVIVTGHTRVESSGVAMSNYGRSNSYEFFAEAFANAHLGAPNAIGLAMRDYLRDNKLK